MNEFKIKKNVLYIKIFYLDIKKVFKDNICFFEFNIFKTIYPTSSWLGVYFSKELKAVAQLGYQIKLINGYEFSKIDLFSDYVNTFFLILNQVALVQLDGLLRCI